MKKFMDDNFVLETKTAQYLYHDHAKNLPIIDYHNHLIPKEIADNIKYENITQVWLYGDHYKWRAMRTNGVEERYCTGDASDWEKFSKWAETIPYTLRNPLYHWTHLELQRYFGIKELLSPETARKIYDKTAQMLQSDLYSARGLMSMMKVEVACTTDDPADDLAYHKKIKESGFDIKVLPTWRPDMSMAVENPETYNKYIEKLEAAAGISISKLTDLLEALRKRQEFFVANGCKLSDHGVDIFYYDEYTRTEIEKIFDKVRSGKQPDKAEIIKFRTAMLFELSVMNYEKGWTQQFHIGPIRNNNTRMLKKIGPNTGFDSMGDRSLAEEVAKFFDKLDTEDKLAKTILYNINPKDNETFATMIGNFQDGSVPGKIQFGSGWWFLDQMNGMERQMNALSTLGLLSRFVGMLTDSRSFLSFPRHEYFRRILCNLIGNDVEKGLLPNDKKLLGKMVEDISYYNAKNYFNF